MAGEDLLREAQDPSTGPDRLAQIAQTDRSTWLAVAAHPQAYDGLLAWLGEHGDDAVRGAIAGRSAASALPPPPPPPPAPVVPTDPAPTQPLATQPAPPAPVTAPPSGAPWGPPSGPPSGPPVGPPSGPPYGHQAFGAPGAPPPARRSSGRVALWAVAAVVLIAALGVGGFFGVRALTGDDDTSEASSASSETSESPDDSESVEPSDDAETDTGDDTDTGASSEFCTTLKEQQDASMDLLSSPGSDPDLDKLRDQLEESAEVYNGLADDGPAEIGDDLRAIADYYETLQKVSSGSSDPSEFSDQLQPFAEASQRVATYYYQNCS